MRSYELHRYPEVLVFDDEDVQLDANDALWRTLREENGLSGVVKIEGNCLVLPRPYEVRIKFGRTLRSEEYDWYGQLCLKACENLSVHAVRYSLEELYVFDWDRFKPADKKLLVDAYAVLPGWLGAKNLPTWFGEDEALGPTLSASFEPPGLQVSGILELSVYEAWRRDFLEKTAALPVRSLE